MSERPEVLFFSREPAPGVTPAADPAAWEGESWAPHGLSLRPRGLPLLPFAVWWLFHRLHLFRNSNYRVYLVRSGDTVVHRTCVFPGYFRFPFMAAGDLQVGDIWTLSTSRGQGLASRTLARICEDFGGTRLWFLCEAENQASAALAQRCGFVLRARGRRQPRWGLSLLGAFTFDS